MSLRRTISGFLALLALASWLSAQISPLDEAVRLIREARFDQALIKLQEAHRIAPRNATIENLLGITETKLGHIAEADDHYRNAIRLDPTQAAPHRNLGFNLLTAKDYLRAEPELRDASRLNPSDNFAHYYLMLLALATDHDAEAVEQASHAIQLVDNDAEAAAELVEAEVRLGRVDDAAGRIERLEQANQLPADREYRIAVLLSQRSFYEESVRCFRRIAALDPSWESRYNLALALLYDGQAADASTLLAALHTERPAHADTLMFLGSAFELQQKMPEALEAYRAAVVADPANPDRILDYTRLLIDLDRYDEAIEVVQTGMAKSSGTVPLQLRLGAAEMIKADYTAARETFKAALASDPELDAAYVGLAQTYSRQGNDVEAMHILEAARARFPGHYPLEYYFGLLAARLGREQDAAVALEKASQLEPMSLDPFYELGKLHVAQKDWPKAQQAFEHALELNPEFQPAHYQLIRVYAHLGLGSKAAQEEKQTRALTETQRKEALRRQRERGASFQPHTAGSPAP